MKKLSLCLLLSSNLLFAQEATGPKKIENNTLSDEEIGKVIEQVKAIVKNSPLPFDMYPRELKNPYFAYNFSKQLKAEFKKNDKLKKFVEDGDLEISPALLIGFAGSSMVGLEIKSENFKLCLPCSVGHNNFAYGLSESKSSEKKISNEMKCANITGRISRQSLYSEYLGALVIPYTNESSEKGYIVYKSKDDSTFIYPKEAEGSKKYRAQKIECADKKFSLQMSGGKPFAYEPMDSYEVPESLKCTMQYNEKIAEVIEGNFKKGLDQAYSDFLKRPKDKDDFLDLLESCKDVPYGKVVLDKIRDQKSETKESATPVGLQK